MGIEWSSSFAMVQNCDLGMKGNQKLVFLNLVHTSACVHGPLSAPHCLYAVTKCVHTAYRPKKWST